MNRLVKFQIQQNYEFDTVTCYEYPIASVLNYYNEISSDTYILLSKLYGIYMFQHLGKGVESKEKVLDEIESNFGYVISKRNKPSWKYIKQNIDKGIPVIVGVNLKELYYSNYYKKSSWGHWLLIIGYDEENETLTVLDNSQFEDIGEEYKNFKITYKMLKEASKEYRKVFGEKYTVTAISEKNGEQDKFDFKSTLIYILEKYMSVNTDTDQSYRQIKLLAIMHSIIASNNIQAYDIYYLEEFKKKIININKFRRLYFEKLIKIIKLTEYEEKNCNIIIKKSEKLCELWESFVLIYSVKINADKECDLRIDSEIIELEKEVQFHVGKYLDFIRKKDLKELKRLKNVNHFRNTATKMQNTISYKIVNDKDNIISGSDDAIIFKFNGSNTYNWWLEDNSPKVIIFHRNDRLNIKNNIMEKIVLKTQLKIIENETDGQNSFFKAGIFVKSLADNKMYFCSIDGGVKVSIDDVGFSEKCVTMISEYNMKVILESNKLSFSVSVKTCDKKENSDKEKINTRQIISEEGVEIGLACKTWGKGNRLEIVFLNTKCEVNNAAENLCYL